MNRQTGVEKPQGEHDEQIQHFLVDDLVSGDDMRENEKCYSSLF